jgi:alanyl-tRNA synthetase
MASLANLTNTLVTFPSGDTQGISKVMYTQRYSAKEALIIVEKTPFHPLSCSWPDQQADTGHLKVGGKEFNVTDTLTAAINLEDEADMRLLINTDIPSRHTTPSWRFFVAHIVDDPADELKDCIDKEVELLVNTTRRKLLSASHTSTHLAALAMNKAAKDYWRKEVDLDGLSNPDLDRLAMEASNITPGKATDTYRFGKSLRKKYGFEAADLIEHFEGYKETVNGQLTVWLATDSEVIIEIDGPELEARRRWTCELDGRLVKFPCGGTHLTRLGELESISVTFELSGEKTGMTMHTTPRLRTN